MTVRYDCIVVGAGFSGLAAAARLKERDKSVLVLEARDRVGGRTAPGDIAGHRVDLGGMWLSPKQTLLAKLARAHGVETYPQYLGGMCRVSIDGRVREAKGDAFEGTFPVAAQLQLLAIIKLVDRLTAKVSPESPWETPGARALDAESVESWVARRTLSPLVRRVIDLVCNSVFCANAREISMLFFVFYCRAAGGLELLLGMQGDGAQALLFDGGVHQLAQKLGEILTNDIMLDAPVHAVTQDASHVEVSSSAGDFEARRVILTVPPPHVLRMAFTPELPYAKRSLLARQPMGSCIKAWIAYEQPFWRDRGFNGFLISEDHAFTPVFDATPDGATVGLLAGFFDAHHATLASEWSGEERRDAALDAVASMLGKAALRPTDYIEKNWNEDPWSGGCYGAYMAPGALTTRGHALREPIGRLHWGGTETALRWTGYIEGALESGQRAADEVLQSPA